MNGIENLGKAIKQARLKKGYSQEYLAEMLNVTPTHIKHIENSRRYPSVEILFAIMKKLDMSIDNVVLDDNDKNEAENSIDILIESCTEREKAIVKDLILSLVENR